MNRPALSRRGALEGGGGERGKGGRRSQEKEALVVILIKQSHMLIPVPTRAAHPSIVFFTVSFSHVDISQLDSGEPSLQTHSSYLGIRFLYSVLGNGDCG